MKVRFESWGAWVRLESTAALVALDREGARALGLDGRTSWRDPPVPSLPLEVHLAVTSRCGAGCDGCYLDAKPDGDEPLAAELERTLDALRDAGVFTVAFGGGEPTTRDDLGELAAAARARGLVPVLTTSGLGLSESRAERLRGFAQVNVSYDGPGDTYASVRGFDGAKAAELAIERLVRQGIRVGVNVVLTQQSFPRLAETVAVARKLGAVEVQLLRYKPAGRALSLSYASRRLTQAQGRALGPLLRELAETHAGSPSIRIDCALVCFLSADDELAGSPARLVQFGVFGCEAGGALAAVTVEGRVAPCSFAPASSLRSTELRRGHARDEVLASYRGRASAPPEPCASCAIRQICKGGCQVVAAAAGELGPDPECPRVIAHRAMAP